MTRWRTSRLVGVALLVAAVGAVAVAGRHRASPRRSTSPAATAGPSRPVTTEQPGTYAGGAAGATDRTGVRQLALTFIDPTRATVARSPLPARPGRVLSTRVWLPTAPGPWPLVVFGHGFAVQGSTYEGLLRAIAAEGFVVAAPDFPGSTSAASGAPNELDVREEPCDLLFVAHHLQEAGRGGGPLAGDVAGGRVALAGQSDGATAAAFAALSDPVGACGGPPVAAVVAFSSNPVPRRAGADAAVLAITGSADAVNPPSHTRALYEEAPASAYLLTSLGDGHLAPSTDSPHHTEIAMVVVDFLRAALLDSTAARHQLVSDAHRPGLVLASRP